MEPPKQVKKPKKEQLNTQDRIYNIKEEFAKEDFAFLVDSEDERSEVLFGK